MSQSFIRYLKVFIFPFNSPNRVFSASSKRNLVVAHVGAIQHLLRLLSSLKASKPAQALPPKWLDGESRPERRITMR